MKKDALFEVQSDLTSAKLKNKNSLYYKINC